MADLTFDFDAVTTRMLIDFKEKTGSSLLSLLDDDGSFDLNGFTEEQVAGFIWLCLRMSGNPGATWDDALDTPLTDVRLADAEQVDPTNASNES